MTRPATCSHDLVGISSIAERLLVEKTTVNSWRRRAALDADATHTDATRDRRVPMPDPDYMVDGKPVWDWPTIEGWARATNRLPLT